MAAAALTGGTPSRSSVGVTIAPAVSTAAEDEPVIMPGSISSPMMVVSLNATPYGSNTSNKTVMMAGRGK